MQSWVIGNWKQNPATKHDTDALIEALLSAHTDDDACQLMVAPSCVHLAGVSDKLAGSGIRIAAQDISAHSHSTGAFTGDCSAQQVTDAGATWTLLGHSERREYHLEDNAALVKKMHNALAQDLGIVLCVGETQAQHDNGDTFKALDDQLAVIDKLLSKTSSNLPRFDHVLTARLIIAYEPVWAIGTGNVPSISDIEKTHEYIKQAAANIAAPLADVSVLYGGSVNADNAAELARASMIDGALVGGASLKADSFMAIARAFSCVR